MSPQLYAIQNFSTGITSDLRVPTESPRFSRIWNFQTTVDRAIQQMGLEEFVDKGGYPVLIGADTVPTPLIDGAYLGEPIVFIVHNDLSASAITLYNPLSIGTFNLGSGSLAEGVVPVHYNGKIFFAKSDATVWYYDLLSNTSTEILDSLNLTGQDIFFQPSTQDDRLYIFTGRSVHMFESPLGGVASTSNPYAQWQPLTQFMQQGDRNGNLATYTGFQGPQLGTIREVAQLQSLLSAMGYNSGPVDGVYGTLTKTSVEAFQGENFATGNYEFISGGQAAGDPLVVDGIVGPETLSALNAATPGNTTRLLRENIMRMPGPITAVCEYGAYITFATKSIQGLSQVFYWDRSLDARGDGSVGLITASTIGVGVVQVLNVVDGDLIAITSPANKSYITSKYEDLLIYNINASFDVIPPSRATLVGSYKLISRTTDSANTDVNKVLKTSFVHGNKLYFCGQLYFETFNDWNEMSGVFSVTKEGALNLELAVSTENDQDLAEQIRGFSFVGTGMCVTTEDKTYITSSRETDTVSGFVTNIIGGDAPFVEKKLDNIYLGLQKGDNFDKIEIWVRDFRDVGDSNGGWLLAHSGDTTESKFSNTITVRRLANEDAFPNFKELQVKVLVFGTGTEITSFATKYTPVTQGGTTIPINT